VKALLGWSTRDGHARAPAAADEDFIDFWLLPALRPAASFICVALARGGPSTDERRFKHCRYL